MTLPTLLLALLLAVLYGALYHLIRGGGFWWLVWYLALSLVGFFTGHLVGTWFGWDFLSLGSLKLGMGSVLSVLVLLAGDWITHLGLRR